MTVAYAIPVPMTVPDIGEPAPNFFGAPVQKYFVSGVRMIVKAPDATHIILQANEWTKA